jgi:16S rRNA (uracil1498-N3)-methyltransferase
MRHRIHIAEPAAIGATIAIRGDEFHHAVRVVRVREKEPVELFDGRGFAASGTIESLAIDHAIVRVEAPIESREPSVDITLAMAIIQLDRFELVLQKATELGVRTIVPVETERVEIRPERYRGKMERWEKIVFEATKQCGRAMIPVIEEPAPFQHVIARPGTKVLFDADAEPSPIGSGALTLFIGPEGGWSDKELALAREHGAAFQRLGPRRLRAETAAIVAVANYAVEAPAT